MEAEGQGGLQLPLLELELCPPGPCGYFYHPHHFFALAPPPLAVPLEPLAKLGVLLGKNWQKALQVVDKKEVQCYQAEPSGRRLFEVSPTANSWASDAQRHPACP